MCIQEIVEKKIAAWPFLAYQNQPFDNKQNPE